MPEPGPARPDHVAPARRRARRPPQRRGDGQDSARRDGGRRGCRPPERRRPPRRRRRRRRSWRTRGGRTASASAARQRERAPSSPRTARPVRLADREGTRARDDVEPGAVVRLLGARASAQAVERAARDQHPARREHRFHPARSHGSLGASPLTKGASPAESRAAGTDALGLSSPARRPCACTG